eukprot:1988874-Prymnesium_polylepis.1
MKWTPQSQSAARKPFGHARAEEGGDRLTRSVANPTGIDRPVGGRGSLRSPMNQITHLQQAQSQRSSDASRA